MRESLVAAPGRAIGPRHATTQDERPRSITNEEPSSDTVQQRMGHRPTLSEEQYCEWIEYTTRNNLDAPGVTNEAPPVSSHCTPIKKAGDKLIFAR